MYALSWQIAYELNTNMFLSQVNKQFTTWVHESFYMYRQVSNIRRTLVGN